MSQNINPDEIVSLQEFYQFAKKNTPVETWDYIIGAADTETTFKKNRYSLDSYAFKPRILRDVEHVDTSIELFGYSFLIASSVTLISSGSPLKAIHRKGP